MCAVCLFDLFVHRFVVICLIDYWLVVDVTWFGLQFNFSFYWEADICLYCPDAGSVGGWDRASRLRLDSTCLAFYLPSAKLILIGILILWLSDAVLRCRLTSVRWVSMLRWLRMAVEACKGEPWRTVSSPRVSAVEVLSVHFYMWTGRYIYI